MTKKITYEKNQFEVYITNKEIKKRIKEIANDLNTDFISERPIFIGVLNGCIYFMMDLLKEIKFDYEIDFVKIKSYVGMEQHDISSDLLDYTFLKDKNIIIVEDIIDSGNTINFLYEKIMTCNPKSCTVITLLKKRREKHKQPPAVYIKFINSKASLPLISIFPRVLPSKIPAVCLVCFDSLCTA